MNTYSPHRDPRIDSCGTCKGTGRYTTIIERTEIAQIVTIRCPACFGSGLTRKAV